MAVDHVKSPFITNLDAAPPVQNTAGEGGPAMSKTSIGYATGIAASSIDATYQFIRVPSNAKVHGLNFESAAQAAGTIDIGVYYATDGEGGRPMALLAAAAISRTFFAAAVALTSASAPTNVLNQSGNNPITKRVQPLWQALGLASDPGGYFDIVGTLAAAITTGGGLMGMSISYTD